MGNTQRGMMRRAEKEERMRRGSVRDRGRDTSARNGRGGFVSHASRIRLLGFEERAGISHADGFAARDCEAGGR